MLPMDYGLLLTLGTQFGQRGGILIRITNMLAEMIPALVSQARNTRIVVFGNREYFAHMCKYFSLYHRPTTYPGFNILGMAEEKSDGGNAAEQAVAAASRSASLHASG